MAEREFADAIARGWRDAGFTKKSDGQYKYKYKYKIYL